MAKKEKANNLGLTEEQMRNIDNYKDDITHIEGTINQIQARPSMYLGAMNDQGLFTMFREIFQNSVDQLVSDKSPCDYIEILYDERNYMFRISDNGMGIPREWIHDIFTEGHTGKNLAEKKLYDYSAGTNGIGAKAVNALSEYFDVYTYNYTGYGHHLRYERGILKEDQDISNKELKQGTSIEFTPNHDIMGATPLESTRVYLLVRDILSLLKIGAKIDYTSINKKGKVYHELMINEDGIMTNIIAKSKSMLITPIAMMEDNGRMRLECAFVFDQQDLGGEDITAYANMCPTSTVPLNSHVTGTLDGICTWFTKYINNTYLTDKEKAKYKIISADVRMGLKLMISAWSLEPLFTGQAKEIFSNIEYKPFAKDVVMRGLDSWAKSKSQDLVKVCKYIKDIALMRIKSESEKVKITAKYETSATTGLPQKYVRASSKNPSEIELFIVEGDSALGSARDARDPRTQAIFPIRGKILNVFQATTKEILNNAEVVGIIHILGAGYGNSFDINKLKVGKVVFMSDELIAS